MPTPDLTLVELADLNKVKLLAQHPDVADEEKTQLRNYARLIKNGKVEVGYNTSKRIQMLKDKNVISQVYGRKYPQGNALGRFSRSVRATLCEGKYWDIDFTNSHLVILKQFLTKNTLDREYPALVDYVEKRDEHLNALISLGWTRAEAKQLYLRLTYLGSAEKHCEDINADAGELPQHARQYGHEIREASKWVSKGKFKEADLIGSIKEQNKKLHGNYRVKASSYLSCLLGYFEDLCLMALNKYLTNEGYSVDVLMYDGLMIRIPEGKTMEDFQTEVLAEAENQMEIDTGYKMDLTIKAFDNPLDLTDVAAGQFANQEDWTPMDVELDCDEDELENWTPLAAHKMRYSSMVERYYKAKKYFELFVFGCDDPNTYLFVPNPNKSRVPLYRSSKDVAELLNQMPNCSISPIAKPEPFAAIYKRDPVKKRYAKLEFMPYNKEGPTPTNVYNLFNGYSPQCYLPFDRSQRDELVEPFLELLRVNCGGKRDNTFSYALNWVAQLIQYPSKKNAIGWTITGNQGTGKGTLIEVFRKLLGEDFVKETAQADQIFGKYAEGRQGKLLVNANECNMKATADFEGIIKAAISDTKMDVNPKGIRAYEINDYARFIITTNKSNPFPVDCETKNRRIFMTRASSEWMKWTYQQWGDFRKQFEKPEFCAALYDYLMERPIDGYDWVGNLPMTEIMKVMYDANTPLHINYMSDLTGFMDKWENVVNHSWDVEGGVWVSVSRLFGDYKQTMENGKYAHIASMKAFSRALKAMALDMVDNGYENGLFEKRRTAGNGWMLNGRLIDTYLREKYPYLYSSEN